MKDYKPKMIDSRPLKAQLERLQNGDRLRVERRSSNLAGYYAWWLINERDTAASMCFVFPEDVRNDPEN